MSGLAECGSLNRSGSRCLPTSVPARGSDFATNQMATAQHLMPKGSGLTIPRLDGVPREHQLWQGEQAAARTAAAFLKAGLASEEDWYRAQRNPFDFVKMTLNRWVSVHWATEIQEEFRLHLTLSTSLDRYFTDQEPSATSELHLTIEPESAGYVVADIASSIKRYVAQRVIKCTAARSRGKAFTGFCWIRTGMAGCSVPTNGGAAAPPGQSLPISSY